MSVPRTEKRWQVDQLSVAQYATNREMGQAAASLAAETLIATLRNKGLARLILATGNSQLTFLETLRSIEGIDWSRVTVFHMDEYLGIDPNHPASFPKFLEEHFLRQTQPGTFHPIPSQPSDPLQACAHYEQLLRQQPIDLVAMGWGENGHIAFNDPPEARFDEPAWVKIVDLAEASRRQQVGEGHFAALSEVPRQAITLTIPALLAPEKILCIVPEVRKAKAVRSCLAEPIHESRPGSILRRCAHATLLLDADSASML